MTNNVDETGPTIRVEVRVTNCPECGAEWERVVTVRPKKGTAGRLQSEQGVTQE